MTAEFTAEAAEDPLCRLSEASVPVLAGGLGQMHGGGKGKNSSFSEGVLLRVGIQLLLILPGLSYEGCFTENGKVYHFLERCGVFGLCL